MFCTVKVTPTGHQIHMQFTNSANKACNCLDLYFHE